MEEIELNILRLINEVWEPNRHYANSNEMAQSLKISHQDIQDFLDMLETQGYVSLIKNVDNTGACLTAQGRLLLTHPEYMLSKGYGDASDVLKALEKVVSDSDSIPQPEKETLIEKLKDLYHDPYVQSIGSGFIVEGLKKLAGM